MTPALLLLTTGAAVCEQTVMVAGRIVKHEGQLVGVDLDGLRSRAEQSRDRLFATPPAEA